MPFGFHKGLGARDVPLPIANFVQKALDSCHEECRVALDFSAAFVHVNHKATFKLRQLGVGGLFLNT